MAEVRGKFRVTQVIRRAGNPTAAEIKLEAIYSGTPEDNSFSAATPFAELTMSVTNPAAVEKLPLGKFFYLDFTPVEE